MSGLVSKNIISHIDKTDNVLNLTREHTNNKRINFFCYGYERGQQIILANFFLQTEIFECSGTARRISSVK